MNNGRRKCEFLREIRREVARQYNLRYDPKECHHDGDCKGTCPVCDAELEDIQKQFKEKGIEEVSFNEILNKETDEFYDKQKSSDNNEETVVLQGDVSEHYDERLMGMMALNPNLDVLKESKLLFMECCIAGIQYHEAENIWNKLEEGIPVKLEREYNNSHDHNAVKILCSGEWLTDDDDNKEYALGYIPQKMNRAIVTILDMGWTNVFSAEISELYENSDGSKRIKIAIYAQNVCCVEKKKNDNIYRAQYLDKQDYRYLCKSLYEKGHIYFRWGGFPPWEKDLPVEGEKVFFIYKRENDAIVYLMKVIAVDDKCAPFLDNIEDLDCCDDCAPYILTNIKGPITLDLSAIKFLDDEPVTYSQPDVPVSREAAYRLKSLL